MPPDLIPNLNNRAMPFSFVAVLLDLFCSALLAAVQSGTLVPCHSPWLSHSNATGLCAKSDLGLCAYPPLPVPWKRLSIFAGIHDGYFKENSLARGGVGETTPLVIKVGATAGFTGAFAGALARAATHLLHNAPHYLCGVVWTLCTQNLRFANPLLQQRFHGSMNYACFVLSTRNVVPGARLNASVLV